MPRELSTKDINKAIRKLERPPQPHNFVRNIFNDTDKTARSLVRLALNFPTVTYLTGTKVAKDCIDLGLDDVTALNAVRTKGAATSRSHNEEFLRAFLRAKEELRLSGHRTFDQLILPYRVSSSIKIPVKPLTTILDGGKFRTVSIAGWASVPFDDFRWRLLFSIYEDAVFSLEDFRDAKGEFYGFPRRSKDDRASRYPLLAQRGDFELFTSAELREIMDAYLVGLEKAKKILRAMPVSEHRGETTTTATDDATLWLF